MKILMLDNYDSFTFNIVHIIRKLGYDGLEVFRNDKIAMEDIKKYDKIILSPGPGIPSEAGILLDLIKEYAPSKPILGVCLGHQAIGEVFGSKLTNLENVYHGIATDVEVKVDDILFKGLTKTFSVGRYHSWVVDENNVGADIEVTAVDATNKIMALRHKKYDVRGVQFHPESVLTPLGETILDNWLRG